MNHAAVGCIRRTKFTSRQRTSLASVFLLTVVANYVLATRCDVEPSDSAVWYVTLGIGLASQWCLLALICAFAGSNLIRGLLLGSGLATASVGAVLPGMWQADAFSVERWLPLVTFPWLLPISAIGLSVMRIAFGWRFVASRESPTSKISLADCMMLMLWCACGAIVLRYVHIATTDQHFPVVARLLVVICVFSVAALVLIAPMLWWLRRLEAKPGSTSLFLFVVALTPTWVTLAAIITDAKGIEWVLSAWPMFVAIQAPFTYFPLCVWLLKRCGIEVTRQQDRSSILPIDSRQGSAIYMRLVMLWFMCISIGFGYLTYVVEQRKLLDADFVKLLERTNRTQFLIENDDKLSFSARHRLSDDDLRSIGAASQLRRLSLDGNAITDNGLRHLRELSDLEFLSLTKTKITDHGIDYLNGLKRLTTIALSDTAITYHGLQTIDSPDRFKELFLADCQIASPGPAVLHRFTHLESLGLNQTDVTDGDLVGIEKLTKLKQLGLDHTSITDASIARLSAPRLVGLSLAGTRVTGKGFEPWPSQHRLRWLFANNSTFDDEGTNQLYRFSDLEFLYLSHTQVTSLSPTFAQQNSQLKVVELTGTKIGDLTACELLKLPELVNLSLANTLVTDEAFDNLTPRKLARLYLDGTAITNETLRTLAVMTTLSDLRLAGTKVTNQGIAHLEGMRLELLDLTGTAVTAEGLIASQAPQLQSVIVERDQFTSVEVDLLNSHGIELIFPTSNE